MIEQLKKNVDAEIGMFRELSSYIKKAEIVEGTERELLEKSARALQGAMKIVNSTIPSLVRRISVGKKLPSLPTTKKKVSEFENVEFRGAESYVDVVLSKEQKEEFLKELSISDYSIRKLRKKKSEVEKDESFKSARGYLKIANKLFLSRATKQARMGKFKELSVSIKKANIDILFESYIAMLFLSICVSVIVGVVVLIFLLFFDIALVWPFFSVRTGGYFMRILKTIWIPIAAPIVTFLAIYYYPSAEQKSIEKRINQELPFAVIHMSAISGSGIAPAEIFRIIGLSREYPYLRREIRKVLNQINLYGYDLLTALQNASNSSPSERLSELFSGMSTTITTGAKIQDFLEKRSESLLLNYRLEREGYTKLVETFLDIYISIAIAAPMVFLLLIVMMLVSGLEVGFSTAQVSLISVFGIAVLNMIFLVVLHLKQPSY